ncbi:hypothetical protein GMORB2_7494 [Geosmithia morbida]|uniref:Uncharacterized protein n=1 Tax=Geosmithia morbida TaxID=1094350 RepID=A0A9P4YTY0_9HYPO|nr:uncharacterized protein GMORB2_7494 [Geosmithia morbida]KAF4122502.1 hypothetical protein GMORB2_7494 [Geosmithia morbida]
MATAANRPWAQAQLQLPSPVSCLATINITYPPTTSIPNHLYSTSHKHSSCLSVFPSFDFRSP